MTRRGLSSKFRLWTAPLAPGCSGLRTARSGRRSSCRSARRGPSKSLHPDEVRDLGAQILLGNTYHLHFRPGDELIRELGGLHRFMGWDAPILTDSGGFQVFSLRDTIVARRRQRRHVPERLRRRATRFTPELAAAIQANLGSDIAMCLDQVPPAGVPRRALEEAVRRTTLWAGRQRDAPRAEGQLRFGITQGGIDPELRRRSTEEIAELGFDGNAIGGLAIGEDRDAMFEVTDWVGGAAACRQAALLHGDRRPRGHPRGDRGRRRHVRLRAPDPHGAHRQRAHAAKGASTCGTPASPATRRPWTTGATARPARASAAPTSAIWSTRTSC